MALAHEYTQNRNYGCRIRSYTMQGLRMLSLENQKLRLVIAPDKGADILDYLYKPTDTELLWHSFNPPRSSGELATSACTTGNFMDCYAGGWQTLFPTHGQPADYHGMEIGMHGEACLSRWDFDIVTDTPEQIEVRLSTRTLRTPFLVEKWVRLVENDPTVYLKERITNLGSLEMDFMWGQHPAYGFPFLDGSVELRLKGTPTVVFKEPFVNPNCPFDHAVTGKWPCLPGKDGKPVDMSHARDASSRIYMEYGITDLEEGAYELVNHNKGLGVRMTWDPKIFGAIWVWGLYCGIEEAPWFGRTYVMGVEPWTSVCTSYSEAKACGKLHRLAPGASVETCIRSEVFEAK